MKSIKTKEEGEGNLNMELYGNIPPELQNYTSMKDYENEMNDLNNNEEEYNNNYEEEYNLDIINQNIENNIENENNYNDNNEDVNKDQYDENEDEIINEENIGNNENDYNYNDYSENEYNENENEDNENMENIDNNENEDNENMENIENNENNNNENIEIENSGNNENIEIENSKNNENNDNENNENHRNENNENNNNNIYLNTENNEGNMKDKINDDNDENQDKEKIELKEEEILSDIYDLPLSINIIKQKKQSYGNEVLHSDNNENSNPNIIENKEKEINNNKNKEEENIQKESEQNNDNNNNNENYMNNNNNEENITLENNKILYISPIVKSDSSHNTVNFKTPLLEVPEGVKFGVDQSGNPINITQFFEENNTEQNNKNKIIAFIIQKDDKSNYLIDVKGNILQKTDDDYYCYKDGNEYIIIKDFDIQHPELRVFGHRKINFEQNQNDKEEENNEIKNKKVSASISNMSIKTEKNKENKNIFNDNINKETKHISIKSNISEKTDYLFNNNIDEIVLSNNSKNKSVVINDNRLDRIKKIDIFQRKKTFGNNNDFYEQMNIWRQRYGKKTITDSNKKEYRNYSYNQNHKDKDKDKDALINRTDSILKMTSQEAKSAYEAKNYYNYKKIPTLPADKSNYKSMYNKNILSKQDYLLNDYENPLIKRQNNSFSKNAENPLLNDYKNYNSTTNVQKINSCRSNMTNFHKFQRNKTLQYIHSKYNYKKELNSFNSNQKIGLENINYKIRENLLQNIKQKYKNLKFEDNNFNIINNANNYNIPKKYSKENDQLKKHTINNYIYNNLRKINENKYVKKNLSIKCSILSNEASRIIRDFNKKQKEREQIINIGNINYYNYIPINPLNKNNSMRNNNYAFIGTDDNQNFYLDYNNNNMSEYDDFKIKILPNKIKKNKIDILNNNYYNDRTFMKENNNYNYYRKIKHNTSKNNYNNF